MLIFSLVLLNLVLFKTFLKEKSRDDLLSVWHTHLPKCFVKRTTLIEKAERVMAEKLKRKLM